MSYMNMQYHVLHDIYSYDKAYSTIFTNDLCKKNTFNIFNDTYFARLDPNYLFLERFLLQILQNSFTYS